MVVTNSYFSDQAVILAHANGVRLRFRDDLARELVALGPDFQEVAAPGSSASEAGVA